MDLREGVEASWEEEEEVVVVVVEPDSLLVVELALTSWRREEKGNALEGADRDNQGKEDILAVDIHMVACQEGESRRDREGIHRGDRLRISSSLPLGKRPA
jgi:hypothetical protein